MVYSICKNDIYKAINSFDSSYHSSYFEVRKVSREYLGKKEPDYDVVIRLTDELRKTLLSWGAGKRMAPMPREADEFILYLMQNEMHSMLKSLSALNLADFSLLNGKRSFKGKVLKQNTLEKYDRIILQLLNRISSALFINNTNVTYPMKTILLLTAHTPALDGNVRKGLSRGGFKGFNSTRYLLPQKTKSADAKKIVSLPFVLGKIWNDNEGAFIEGIKKSVHPELTDEAGRIFDILLFMQSKNAYDPIIKNYNESSCWYDLA